MKLNIDWNMVKNIYLFQNLSVKEIAARFGCLPDTVSFHLRKVGVDTRYRYNNFDIAAIRAAYEAGRSLEQIAVEIGINRDILRRWLIRKGVKIRTHKEAQVASWSSRDRHRIKKKDWLQIDRLLAEGRSKKYIAKFFGCLTASIATYCARRGIKTMTRGEFQKHLADVRAANIVASIKWSEVKAVYDSGVKGIKRLSRELKLSPRRIRSELEMRGSVIRKNKESLEIQWRLRNAAWGANLDEDKMIEEYRSGVSLSELKRRYGHSRKRLTALMKSRNIEVRAYIPNQERTVLSAEMVTLILADAKSGMSISAIRLKHSIGWRTVARTIRENSRPVDICATHDIFPSDKGGTVNAQVYSLLPVDGRDVLAGTG